MTYNCTKPCNHPIDKCWGAFMAVKEYNDAVWEITDARREAGDKSVKPPTRDEIIGER